MQRLFSDTLELPRRLHVFKQQEKNVSHTFVEYIIEKVDEGMTDVFLLLLEDVKSPGQFKRVAEKALHAGKPIIVGKIGRSEAGARAVASHTAALAGSEASYR